jgi:hypothetical protein
MKRLLVGLVTTVVVCGLTLAWSVRRQEVVLQPCPFDPSLHVGVAFQGPHRYFHTGEVQEKIINARIAWFQPVEEPNPDAFDARVSQEPPDEDWDWWTTLYPTTLIVQVTDEQKRLGKAEIWDFETKLVNGVLQALPDGSAISGTLMLEEPTSFRYLIIKDKDEQTLAQTLLEDAKTRLWLVVEEGGWIPHPPLRDVIVKVSKEELHTHTVLVKPKDKEITTNALCIVKYYQTEKGYPPCEGFNEQHFVELLLYEDNEVKTKLIKFGPLPQGCSMLDIRGESTCDTWVQMTPFPPSFNITYCMTKGFYNPEPKQILISPPQVYGSKHVKKRISIDLRSLAPIVAPEQVTLLEKLQDEMVEDPTIITTPVNVPPYSEGGVHWHLLPKQPTVKGIWAVPYRKYKQTSSWFEEFVFSAVRVLIPGIIGRAHPIKIGLAEAAVEAWQRAVAPKKEVEKIVWLPKDAQFIGDFWVLRLSLAHQGIMNPPYHDKNITQDVHVQIVVVRPDGTKEPMYGSLTVERLEATTTPEPPKSPLPEQFTVEEVPKEGKKIALGKGWKWKLTGFAAGMKGVKEIKVPLEPPSVTIEVPAPQPPPDEG